MPGAPRRQAPDRTGVLGGRGRAAFAARLRATTSTPRPPQPAGDRGCSAWPRRPPGGLPKWAARAPGTEGPLPACSTCAEAPKPAEARAENAEPLAAGARRASLGDCLSHRWAGMGGACSPSGAWEDSEPLNLAKNSLPPGRLPGLLPSPSPSPAPCGPRPCSVHREVLSAPQWAGTPAPQGQPTGTGPAGRAGPPVTCTQGGPASWFLCLKSAPGNTCSRDPNNPAWQGQQAVTTSGVGTQIHVPEIAGCPSGPYPLTPIRNQVRSPPLLR